MSIPWKSHLSWGALALASATLVACGGGDPVGPKVAISRVVVAGDSLADAGTFGYKFTTQKAGDTAGYPVWPQIVESAFGLSGQTQCNYYQYSPGGFSPNTLPDCNNFAIGGAKVIYDSPKLQDGSANPLASLNPLNISVQLKKHADEIGFSDSDLLLVDGGGNDIAALTAAFLGAQTNPLAYAQFLSQQLDGQTINDSLANGQAGAVSAAGAYTTALADTFYDAIKSQALDKGARHVAILNAPDITLTPRFKAVLKGVESQAGVATAAGIKAAIQGWTMAFNARLAARAAGDSRVALVDFYADFADQGAHPEDYSLTNVEDASCPVVSYDPTNGLPEYDFLTCSDDALDQLGGPTASWRTYAFSDGFHPTPYGHQLLAASVNRALARAGWL